MKFDWKTIFSPRLGPLVGVLLGAAIIAAALKQLQGLTLKRSYFYLAALDGTVHRCWLNGNRVYENAEDTWTIFGVSDEYPVDLNTLQLSPDQQMVLTVVTDPFDPDIAVVGISADGVALSGTDNTLLSYFPDSVPSGPGDAPPMLKAAQADYDSTQVPDGAPPLVLTATATGADDGGEGMGAFFTAENDLVLEGNCVIAVNPPYAWPGQLQHFWLRLRRSDGSWQRIGQGFQAPSPDQAKPKPAIAFSLGMPIAGGSGRLQWFDGSKYITDGSQLLVAGKPVILPASLAQGVMAFTGPWA